MDITESGIELRKWLGDGYRCYCNKTDDWMVRFSKKKEERG